MFQGGNGTNAVRKFEIILDNALAKHNIVRPVSCERCGFALSRLPFCPKTGAAHPKPPPDDDAAAAGGGGGDDDDDHHQPLA